MSADFIPRDAYLQWSDREDATPDDEGETIEQFATRVRRDGSGEDDRDRLLDACAYLFAHASARCSDEAFRILNKH